MDARQAVLQSGITIESSCLTVFEADPVTVEVSLELLLFEVPDEDLRDALSPYGAIHDERLQKYADSDIHTATRILTMSLACHIPVNLRALRYPCRVSYRGQPLPCPICRSDGHRASSCHLRVKCRRCLQPGHFTRDCKSATPESDPSFVPDDVSAADDDDHMQSEESMSQEFANGDEGGVEAASAPTIPAVPFSASVFFVCRQVLTRSLQRLLLSHLLLLLFRRMCLRMCPRMTLLPQLSVVLRVFQLPFFNGFCVSLTNFPCHPGNLLNV